MNCFPEKLFPNDVEPIIFLLLLKINECGKQHKAPVIFLLIYNSICAQESTLLFAIHKESLSRSFVETKESDMYISAARNRAANATGTINLFIFNKEKKLTCHQLAFV